MNSAFLKKRHWVNTELLGQICMELSMRWFCFANYLEYLVVLGIFSSDILTTPLFIVYGCTLLLRLNVMECKWLLMILDMPTVQLPVPYISLLYYLLQLPLHFKLCRLFLGRRCFCKIPIISSY